MSLVVVGVYERIDALFDDGMWGGRRGIAWRLWESQLPVEYLGEVEGYRLADLVRDDVIESAVRERMMAWCRAGDARAPGHHSLR